MISDRPSGRLGDPPIRHLAVLDGQNSDHERLCPNLPPDLIPKSTQDRLMNVSAVVAETSLSSTSW